MIDNRIFLVENGSIVLVGDGVNEVTFSTFSEFNRYCSDFGIDLTGKVYIDYEPSRNLYIDKTDPSVSIANAPVAAYEDIIDAVDTLITRKADPYYNISVETAFQLKYGEINASRNIYLNNGYTHTDGYTYDTDEAARTNLMGTVTAINMGYTLPAGFTWRTKNNEDVAHDNASIVGLFQGIMAWRSAAYQLSWDRKADLQTLANTVGTTVSDIKAFVAWPV